MNLRFHLSEANKEGYIYNKLLKFRLQTQLLIIKKPCIMTINLLCSVHVNDESNIHLEFPESVLTTGVICTAISNTE